MAPRFVTGDFVFWCGRLVRIDVVFIESVSGAPLYRLTDPSGNLLSSLLRSFGYQLVSENQLLPLVQKKSSFKHPF